MIPGMGRYSMLITPRAGSLFHAVFHMLLAKCCFFARLTAFSSSGVSRSACKKETSAALGQACPGSEQEGPARVAQCPHERRSGARGRCLFAYRGKPGWHSVWF